MRTHTHFCLALAIATNLAHSGCNSRTAAPPPPIEPIREPEGPILAQPVFELANARSERVGAGFFAKSSDGRIAAVTCSHVGGPKSPALRRVSFLDLKSGAPLEHFVKSWGAPGAGGSINPRSMDVDLRTDYLLMPVEGAIDEVRVLELDPRTRLDANERVWLAARLPGSTWGHALMTGYIREDHLKFRLLQLDQPMESESQRGSPVISMVTGKVVGLVARDGSQFAIARLGENLQDRAFLLTPGAHLLKALDAASEFPQLESATGRNGPPP